MKLERSFYLRNDVVQISRELLGKVLCTRINGAVTKAVITETEAYAGVGDKASHAWGGRRTKRTEPMFGEGGTAYIYLCYGIHHLFNVVTAEAGTPHAILVRAGQPLEGEALMKRRRGPQATNKTLLSGPGSVAQALGITTRATGTDLLGARIWIEEHEICVDPKRIEIGPRIGVAYAAEDAARPYRFVVRESLAKFAAPKAMDAGRR
ncbi:MAG TPA: DNA-3-methyladenine glycosylase [Woeseiaceae bacterium]|nr:DNA-3-methyladenine glycosylase [Woeseiaceae bacterium]